MKPKHRILLGVALGFLLPILWLAFSKLLLDDATVTTGSFRRGAGFADSLLPAFLGWLLAGVFSNGFSLASLASVFSDPQTNLGPATSRLFGSGLWIALATLLMVGQGWVMLEYWPRLLPELESGLVWVHDDKGPQTEEAHAQRQSLRKLFVAPRPEKGEPSPTRAAAVGTVAEVKSRFERLSVAWETFELSLDDPELCPQAKPGTTTFFAVWNLGCLLGVHKEIGAVVLSSAVQEVVGQGFTVAINAPASRLEIRRTGRVSKATVRKLVEGWRGLPLLSAAAEAKELGDARAALGSTGEVDYQFFREMTALLLPGNPEWATQPLEYQAGRLSSVLRLVHSCKGCRPEARAVLLENAVSLIRDKFVGTPFKVTNYKLARKWAETAVFWANLEKDLATLKTGLAAAKLCGDVAHLPFATDLEGALFEALKGDTKLQAELRTRLVSYTGKSPMFCNALKQRAASPEEPEALKVTLLAWLREAAGKGPACDVRDVVFPAAAEPSFPVQPAS